MQALDAFLPHIQPWLLAAPEPLVRASLLRAAREFCERTHVIQATVGPLAAVANQSDYPFTLSSADLELVRVKRAWWETQELNLVAPEDIGTPLAYTGTVGSISRQSSRPVDALLSGPLTLTVAPPPLTSQASMLTMRVVVRPTMAATTLPDELFNDWLEGVIAKTILVVAAVPGNMVSANTIALAQSMDMTQVGRACDVARRGRQQAPMRVQGNPFF